MKTGFDLTNIHKVIDDFMKSDKELESIPLEEQGYFEIQNIPNHGKCALMRMAFTTALYCHIDKTGFGPYRFCYPSRLEAVMAINEWDGKDLPPGNWIKAKGIYGDFPNANYSPTGRT